MNLKKLRISLILYVLFDLLIGGVCGGIFPLSEMAAAQTTNATRNQSLFYGAWVTTLTNAVTSGSQTAVPATCYFNPYQPNQAVGTGGASVGAPHQFFPFATNMTVTIVDGSNTETVTPSAVVTPTLATEPAIVPYTCSFTASFANAHSAGVQIVSGDGGVAEAGNDNGAAYGLFNGVIFLQGACTGTANAVAGTYGLNGVDPTDNTLACNSTAATVASYPGTVIPRAGLIKNLSVTATHVGTSSSSGAVTVNVNGTATAITCTIGTGSSCSDTTHSVAVAAGAIVTITYTDQTSDVLAGVNASAVVY